MGLQGVPLTWYSGARPSSIVLGPRSILWSLGLAGCWCQADLLSDG
jgi:hypothetical protein